MSVAYYQEETRAWVREALEIEASGGLSVQTREGRGDLEAWYVDAYDHVIGAKARTQDEAESVARGLRQAAAAQQRAALASRGRAA